MITRWSLHDTYKYDDFAYFEIDYSYFVTVFVGTELCCYLSCGRVWLLIKVLTNFRCGKRSHSSSSCRVRRISSRVPWWRLGGAAAVVAAGNMMRTSAQPPLYIPSHLGVNERVIQTHWSSCVIHVSLSVPSSTRVGDWVCAALGKPWPTSESYIPGELCVGRTRLCVLRKCNVYRGTHTGQHTQWLQFSLTVYYVYIRQLKFSFFRSKGEGKLCNKFVDIFM